MEEKEGRKEYLFSPLPRSKPRVCTPKRTRGTENCSFSLDFGVSSPASAKKKPMVHSFKP